MTERSDRPVRPAQGGGGRLPARARVVIVGGGVIGCSIAYHLAHLGWTDVVLLAQHALTAGTTWHAAGLITSAGFRPVGHLSLATTAQRQEALRREAAWMHGFGVEDTEISAAEVAAMWPLARTDDVLSGFYVADEGRADPVGVATSLAKGARRLGVWILEGVAATGVETRGRRVTAVLTEAGRIETDLVVNAAGMWARQFGGLAGVSVPLQAAEHYYLLTDTVPGMDADLPVIEDPDNYGYYRPEGDGMLVGLFEPVGAPWSLDGIARDFAFGKLPPDWERMEPFLGPALARIPCLAETGVRTFFCGPESFTADVRPLIGPAPELDGYFVATGLNSLGILSGGGVGSVVAQWIADGVPPVDTAQIAVDRTASYETSRRFRRERTVEQLGVLFGDAEWPTWKPSTARNIRRSVLHDRLAAQGAHFAQSAGWEFAEWFAQPGEHLEASLDFSRQASHDVVAREHNAVREAVGVLDMTLMAKLIVQGPDAGAVLSRLSANDVTADIGRIVYTQWLNEAGGIVADVTVTWLEPEKFMVIASDVIHRRIEPMIRRETRPGEFVTVTDVTSGTTLLSVQGPASRELLRRLTDCDLSNTAFPYLCARQLHVGYAPALAVRVTYVGELGFELHVPSEYGAGVYDDLMAAGADLGVRPVGLAAMTSLRLEKGYRDFGVDIDNTDTPLAAGLGFAVAWDKAGGFVGRDALAKVRAEGPPRTRVVGLLAQDPCIDLFGNEPVQRDGRWVGYVRAAAYGHTVGAAVGLAQVSCDDGVTGVWLEQGGFTVRTGAGLDVPARLQIAPFYDPQRLRILAE